MFYRQIASNAIFNSEVLRYARTLPTLYYKKAETNQLDRSRNLKER